ncbi:SymE family type I addiction module toxin [Flavobacterium sp. FlaQc-48]|uniref:SymE family type I addiction module toxin n=1 Tax=Flavobacterium sp. FlaQc-48 TaxID=3374181 RepID=UPI003757B58F
MKEKTEIKRSEKRQLKIHRKYIRRSYMRYVIFPEIRLCGKWLKDIGFECGQSVTVLHEKNKIIITANDEIEKNKK